MKKTFTCAIAMAALAAALFITGCKTKTAYITAENDQVVKGFNERDIMFSTQSAVNSIINHNRIVPPAGSTRAVVIFEGIENHTNSRGRDADILSQNISISLRQQLTDSGKILVLNRDYAQYATQAVTPQYSFKGYVTERILWQDDDDAQVEYNLTLIFVDLATGLEFWQCRVPIRKVADASSVMK